MKFAESTDRIVEAVERRYLQHQVSKLGSRLLHLTSEGIISVSVEDGYGSSIEIVTATVDESGFNAQLNGVIVGSANDTLYGSVSVEYQRRARPRIQVRAQQTGDFGSTRPLLFESGSTETASVVMPEHLLVLSELNRRIGVSRSGLGNVVVEHCVA